MIVSYTTGTYAGEKDFQLLPDQTGCRETPTVLSQLWWYSCALRCWSEQMNGSSRREVLGVAFETEAAWDEYVS